MRIKFLIALALTGFGAAAQATEAPAGDPATGRKLAAIWCSSCHVVGPGAPGSDTAPPFALIAERHKHDPNWVRAWLAAPHPPMPDPNLTRAEIADLSAYLASLAGSGD